MTTKLDTAIHLFEHTFEPIYGSETWGTVNILSLKLKRHTLPSKIYLKTFCVINSKYKVFEIHIVNE